jgi:hypothetical protein
MLRRSWTPAPSLVGIGTITSFTTRSVMTLSFACAPYIRGGTFLS